MFIQHIFILLMKKLDIVRVLERNILLYFRGYVCALVEKVK